MNKILVEVYVPVAQRSFDVYIPLASAIAEILLLLVNSINELTVGLYMASSNSILCDRETGSILDVNISVYESGLCNGSKLILI